MTGLVKNNSREHCGVLSGNQQVLSGAAGSDTFCNSTVLVGIRTVQEAPLISTGLGWR